MEPGSFLHRAAEGVAGVIDSRRVYGDPVEAHNRTVIPVSTTWWCGGGGGGEGTTPPEEGSEEAGAKKDGSGGGFGGFGRIAPVGYIVLEEGGAEWKRIVDFDYLASLGAFVLLVWLRVLRYWIKAKLNT
ncbi:MAG: hypothetical protein JW854_06090 [Actinobacteria bacterium]|nr:hypothetical protein [Actinomycetota bacterium]